MRFLLGFLFVNCVLIYRCIGASVRPRIVGGEDADIENFPYQVAIRARGDYICGGCIISPKHILTAAHCFFDNEEVLWPYFDVSVHTGTSSSRELGDVHRIAKVTIHPKYTGTEKSHNINDIAVIELEDTINFNENQKSVELAKRAILSGMQAILTGWGRTDVDNPDLPVKLQHLKMWLFTYTDCKPHHPVPVHKKQFCAYHTRGHGACIGDSGGPLVMFDQVVGILSYVVLGTCATGAMEIFTNVFAYKDFIESAMKSPTDGNSMDFENVHLCVDDSTIQR